VADGCALTLTGPVERLLAVTVFRYRRAGDSWLAAEVRRLAPGRRYEVYVAPGTSGVFALGGHTVGIGEHSVDDGLPTPELQQATAAAVAYLRAGRTRPELAMDWLAFPWFFVKLTVATVLPRRLHPVARTLAVCWCTAAAVMSPAHGQVGAAVLGACLVADLLLAARARRRQRRAGRHVAQLAPATTGQRLVHVGSV